MLSDSALTTYENVRSVLEDAGRNEERTCQIINAVSDAFAKYAQRGLHYRTDIVERAQATGTAFLLLRYAPIVSVSQVRLLNPDGTERRVLPAEEYLIDEDGETGMLYRHERWPLDQPVGYNGISPLPRTGPGLVEVTYSGGYVTPWQKAGSNDARIADLARTLPYDIEEAVTRDVVTRLRGDGRDEMVSAEQRDNTGTTFRDAQRSFLSAAAKAVAYQYRLLS